jgi:hypothetical protein
MGNMERDWAMAREILVIWDAQTNSEGFTVESRAKHRHGDEWSRTTLWCSVRYLFVKGRSRALLGCMVGFSSVLC